MIAALVLSVTFLAAAFPSSAMFGPLDVGNDIDYDSGWDSGGNDYDGGWSWGDSGDGAVFGGELSWTTIVIIIVVIIVVLIIGKGKGGTSVSSRPTGTFTGGASLTHIPPDNGDRITEAIKQVDPDFNKDKFLSWTKEVFVTLQNAWTARDWEKIRPFESEELYRQHEHQLQEYVRNKTINMVERINVGQTFLTSYTRNKDTETLTVYMRVRMNDYIVSEETGQVVKGFKDVEVHTAKLLTFMRSTGTKTVPDGDGLNVVKCPNCGAPVSVTSAGQCEYCGHIITSGEYAWVLTAMSSVRNDTVFDTKGVNISDEN